MIDGCLCGCGVTAVVQAFEKASVAYGLTHDVTLKTTIELADLLLMRRGQAQALELVQDLLTACKEANEPLLSAETTGSSTPESTSESTDTSKASAAASAPNPIPAATVSPVVPSRVPVLPALTHASPFWAIYPSFTPQPRAVLIAQLLRVRAQCGHQLARVTASEQPATDTATVGTWAVAVRTDLERARVLLLGPGGIAEGHRLVRAIDNLLMRVPEAVAARVD
jgi:hypothetical protein